MTMIVHITNMIWQESHLASRITST